MTSKRYIGNIITSNPTEPSEPYQSSAASGVWSVAEANTYRGADKWPTQGNLPPVEYLVVAGAGGGGGGYYGGGGGAGGLLSGEFTPTGSAITVTVGGGGPGGRHYSDSAPNKGVNGSNSTLTGGQSITAVSLIIVVGPQVPMVVLAADQMPIMVRFLVVQELLVKVTMAVMQRAVTA
jgi:hypothetical protein